MSKPDVSKRVAIATLWTRGVLSWKLGPAQKDLYQCYIDSKVKTVVWSCSRRLGKSYALCIIAIEQCLKKPNSVVKFIAPTAKHITMIITPLFRQILADCPKDLKPEFKSQERVFRFPNGSEVQLAGTDSGRAEGLRGGSSDVCLVDEAGFCDDLRYIVQSILIPTTTTTDGKIILSSTPPKSPDHPFVEYMKEAKYRGSFVMKTIYDNDRLTAKQVQDTIDELGGTDSIDFQREYMCVFLSDPEFTVVPEFTSALAERIVMEVPTPPFADRYVAGDIGFKDLTVFLFAYYDFRNARIVIEDELVMSGTAMTTKVMAEKIKEKERVLWTHPKSGEQLSPYLRVCDNNLIVINDLQMLHGITFHPTPKDDKAAALNNARIMLAAGQIIIHPRCKTLIDHLRNATWAKGRKTYDRSPGAGHYDAVDALVYLVRNVQVSKNPYPLNYGRGNGDSWWHGNPNKTVPQAYSSIKSVFKIRRSLKS